MLSLDSLLFVAAICLIVSLGLAWIASFILYVKTPWLKRNVKANHQLIRTHIDYLLMCMLLIATYYVTKERELTLPEWSIALACIGALGFCCARIQTSNGQP